MEYGCDHAFIREFFAFVKVERLKRSLTNDRFTLESATFWWGKAFWLATADGRVAHSCGAAMEFHHFPFIISKVGYLMDCAASNK